MNLPRVILHLDMDAFYAAVEVREDPRLAGKPLIIGHSGRRGVVSTCSYEARRYGVRSAMPSVTARRLCPDAVWLRGRMSLYTSVSRRIKAILSNYSPVVEPLSIDEAFIDLTGIAMSLDDGARIAQKIKDEVRREENLTSSVGVAPNKFLAKVASDLNKPDGMFVMPLDELDKKLWPLPIERLWGVGPKMADKLHRGGIAKIGDIARCDERALVLLVGEGGAAHLSALAHGRDVRPVRTGRAAKSISEERTYGTDITSPDEIDRALLARSEGVARQLRRQGLTGRTVQIKVRAGDYTTWTRSSTLAAPTDLPEPLVEEARRMFRERIDLAGRGVRLLGLGVSGLELDGIGQAALFEDPAEERSRKLARAADAVRDRLGEKALTRARLIRRRHDDEDDEASSLPAVD